MLLGFSRDDIFPVKTRILVCGVHPEIFSGIDNFHFEHIFAD